MLNGEAAKEALLSVVALIGARCEKGIFDEDAKLHRNVGFVGNRAVFIDVGRFRKSAVDKKQEVMKVVQPLQAWLKDQDASLERYLQERLNEI